MNPTALVAGGYLLLTAPFLVLGGHGAWGWLLAAAHVLAAAALLGRTRPFDPGRVEWTDWLPLLVMPAMYMEIRLLNGWAGGYRDGIVQGWEAALFPSNPSRTWAGAAPALALSEALHFGYLAYYALVYLPELRAWLQGRAEAFHRIVFGLVTTFALCYLTFVVFPVQGPRYLWTPDAPDGPFRALTLLVLEAGSSRGAAFPSSHVAVAVVQAVVTAGLRMVEAWVVVPLAVLLTLGTVYGGFHYAVDAVAGVVLGVLVGWLALRVALPLGDASLGAPGSGGAGLDRAGLR